MLPCSSLDDHMRIKWKTLLVAAASLVTGAVLYTILFVELHQGHRHDEVSRRQREEFEVDRLPLLEERVADAHYQRHGRKTDSKSQDSVNRHSLTKVRLGMAELATNLKYPRRQLSQDGAIESGQDTPDSSGRFRIKQPFHFPQPHYSKADGFLLKSRWVLQLQNFLSTVEGNQVSLVTANQEHQDVVLNWLISAYTVASPPLKNILVLTLDKPLHDLLQARGIATMHISPGMIIEPSAGITRAFSQVHIVRLTVVRLINHYGYDLVNYDSDAILLKNPQIYFEKHKHADMIGTFGKGPMGLFKEWGVTLNTGVLLFRSNQAIGKWTHCAAHGVVSLVPTLSWWRCESLGARFVLDVLFPTSHPITVRTGSVGSVRGNEAKTSVSLS